MKKITFCFLTKSKRCHWAKLPKMGQKLNFGKNWHFFDLKRKLKVIFFAKKSLLVFYACQKNVNFSQSWVFGPFLAVWLSDIFLTWPENKKWFFSQKNHFLFTEQVDSVAGKMCYSNTPKWIWKILLLRPTIGDFHSWFFWTPWGSPFTLRQSLALVRTFY